MLYLILNLACIRDIGVDLPDEVMKIIYQWVIVLNGKLKINRLFSINNYDDTYHRSIRNKRVVELKRLYTDYCPGTRHKINLLAPYMNGKNNNMVKEDYIERLTYLNFMNKRNEKLKELKKNLVSHYNINTKKYITMDEYKELTYKIEKEADDIFDRFTDHIRDFEIINDDIDNIRVLTNTENYFISWKNQNIKNYVEAKLKHYKFTKIHRKEILIKRKVDKPLRIVDDLYGCYLRIHHTHYFGQKTM